MRELDPDVIRWGLDLLQGEPSMSSEFCASDPPSDTRVYDREYASEHNFREDCASVENDEMIAHALQEEYSQVAAAEASGNSNTGGEQMCATILAQDWLGPSMSNFSSGNEPIYEVTERSLPIYEVTEHMEPSNSCSSPGEKLYDGEEYFIELTDDFSALDGEVGKRLNQMVPVPHVPRTIGEIPSVDEATSDYQRLLDRLRLYGLVERKVEGDGNCQFRALSDQFYRTPEHHKFVRQQVVNQLKSHPEIYEGYVLMAYGDYLERMSKNGEWGDHVTLQAAADAYGVKIFILTSFKDTCYIEILPNVQKSKRVIFLSFWAEVHYNSIYPEGELPTSEAKKKKRWCH